MSENNERIYKERWLAALKGIKDIEKKMKSEVCRLQDRVSTLKHENNQLRKLVEKENAKHYKARLRDIVAMADKCLPSMPSGDAKDLVANFRIIAS